MIEWTDKKNRIAVIALHKCGIERACIFELLKQLNITRVFMYHIVKLFLEMEGVIVKDPGRSRVICTPQIINAVRSRIK